MLICLQLWIWLKDDLAELLCWENQNKRSFLWGSFFLPVKMTSNCQRILISQARLFWEFLELSKGRRLGTHCSLMITNIFGQVLFLVLCLIFSFIYHTILSARSKNSTCFTKDRWDIDRLNNLSKVTRQRSEKIVLTLL